MVQMLIVATYNIHRSIGIDRIRDPHRIIRVIEEMNADIVGLQEVDKFHATHHTSTPLDDLARYAGYHIIMGATMQKDYGQYGNALLSRFEISGYHTVDLTMNRREPRGAIDATIKANGRDIRIIVTHFGLKSRERKYQINRLIKVIDSDDLSNTIFMGDINEWLPFGYCVRRMSEYLSSIPCVKSYPSYLPVFALDRIWTGKKIRTYLSGVHKSSLSKIASDHLPVKAVMDIPLF